MDEQKKKSIELLVEKREKHLKEQIDMCFSIYELHLEMKDYGKAKESLKKIVLTCLEDEIELNRAITALNLLKDLH